jgi:hypothetical protein
MARNLSVVDLLRIERFVWTLNVRLFDLSSASRLARRREVRDNLIAAAKDVGVSEAFRRLGGGSRLAEEYLAAELGDRPRHSWIAAFLFAALFPAIVLFCFDQAGRAFEHGVISANPNATGTFIRDGFGYLQDPLTYTYTNGQVSSGGGSFTLLFYAVWIVGPIVAGRLWRLLPRKVAA